MLNRRFARALSLALLAWVSCTAGAATLAGAGSSAAAPVYKVWAREYAKAHGDTLDYAASGSSAGMAAIRKREVDFGASDVMAKPAELAKDELVMFPTVITGVVPVVNLPRVAPNALRLDGPLLAQIFLGSVTQWDAPAIKALNPGVALPSLPIKRVVRADGSGTTFNFSDYLSRVSPDWQRTRGAASKFDWDADALAVKGSSEVSKAVRGTVGAIGYIDYGYVVDDGLAGVQMKNAEGQYVSAGVEGFREAVTHSAWFAKGDFTGGLNDAAGARTWPLTAGTYVAMPRVSTSNAQAERTLRFITWAYIHGDALAREARFVPLPAKVQASAYREIAKIKGKAGEAIGFEAMQSALK